MMAEQVNRAALHHVALRVQDMDRACRFYGEVFGARVATQPYLREGADADVVAGGVVGARYKVCFLAINGEPAIELFEFAHPANPTGITPPTEASITHFCLQVDDVPAAVARAEGAGGSRYWPAIRSFRARRQLMTVADPDGNLIEIVDMPVRELIEGMNANHPERAERGVP